MHRWSKHFSSLFSDEHLVDESSLMRIPQEDVRTELEEMKMAVRQMNPGRSPGIDSIPAVVYQLGGKKMTDCLHDLFIKCWEQGLVPQDLKDATIVFVFKNKGKKSDCSIIEALHTSP